VRAHHRRVEAAAGAARQAPTYVCTAVLTGWTARVADFHARSLQSQRLAFFGKPGRCTRTTQKRWPVGASLLVGLRVSSRPPPIARLAFLSCARCRPSATRSACRRRRKSDGPDGGMIQINALGRDFTVEARHASIGETVHCQSSPPIPPARLRAIEPPAGPGTGSSGRSTSGHLGRRPSHMPS
jgi:hypothetical protein